MNNGITKGLFKAVCKNPDGSVAWEQEFSNGTTDEGRSYMLESAFSTGSQNGLWYIGLISTSSFGSLSTLDTAASHSGWVENTSYTEATRRQWSPDTPTSSAGATTLTSSTPAVFTASASTSVKGAFLTSASAKSATTGTLWATGVFVSDQALITGQTLSITYQTSLS